MRTLITLALLLVCICTSARTTPAAEGALASAPLANAATLIAPATATAATPAPATSITTLQAITVTGVVPGPGLWKVSLGDHVMWILGVVPTLPAGIEWRSNQVARVIAGSQAVLESPDIKLKVDANWFSKLFLLLPIYHAKRNPDGKTLAEVLPPPLYARWQVQKQRYFGNDRGIERYRPILAASKLLKKALHANGLHGNGAVDDKIAALAKQYGVKIVNPDTTLEIHHPHSAIKTFEAQSPEGIACFGQVLGVVEARIPAIRARANAWATGDIQALRTLPGRDYRSICKSAITGAGFAKSLGIDNLPERVENRWLGAAEAALATNTQIFAVLPMHDVLDPDGYLAALQARGYTVTAPDANTDDTTTMANEAVPATAESVH